MYTQKHKHKLSFIAVTTIYEVLNLRRIFLRRTYLEIKSYELGLNITVSGKRFQE